jgi:hypothetical protein
VRPLGSAALACALATLALPAESRGDMIVNSASSVTDRFSGTGLNSGFWATAAGYDLTGVGNTSADGTGAWATAISSNFVLTSHSYAAGGSIYFTDSNGAQVVATVMAEEQVGGTDLQLVQLTAALPATIARYALAPNTPAALTGAAILTVGVPYRAGQNTIDSFGFAQEGVLTQTFTFNYSAGGPALQSWVQPGDGGGPTFIEEPGGGLALAGLHTFYSGTAAQQWSMDTYVSPLMDTMKNEIAALGSTDTPTTAVPEPTSLSLVGMGLGTAFAVGRRRGWGRSKGLAG